MKLKKLTYTSAALSLALALSSAAQAAFIEGKIDFIGTTDLDSTELGSATQVDDWKTTLVSVATGDFSSIPLFSPATFTDGWTFNSGSTPLWTAGIFTFDLLSSSVLSQSSTFLNVVGSGTISAPGYDPTPGTWSYSITNQGGGPSGTFSFVGSTVADGAVPDGGTTVALLGVSLLGLHGVRRKFRKA